MSKILFIVGSLRADSLNAKLAQNLAKLVDGETDFAGVDLPIMNADIYKDAPASVNELREKISAADGVVIVSPEYNRSIAGGTKNMLDWTTWMWGGNVWKDKKVAITGASSGQLGTALAQYETQKILEFVGAKVMHQPEFMLSFAAKQFDKNGEFVAAEVYFAKGYMDMFAKFVDEK